jgi:hypothetical protein
MVKIFENNYIFPENREEPVKDDADHSQENPPYNITQLPVTQVADIEWKL